MRWGRGGGEAGEGGGDGETRREGGKGKGERNGQREGGREGIGTHKLSFANQHKAEPQIHSFSPNS